MQHSQRNGYGYSRGGAQSAAFDGDTARELGRNENTILKPSSFEEGKRYFLRIESMPTHPAGNSQFGHQWMYFFSGRQMMYVPDKLHAEIEAAGARQGDEISITRTTVGRAYHWAVELVQDEPHHPSPPPQPPPQPRPAAARIAAPPSPASAPPREAPLVITPGQADMTAAFGTAIEVALEAVAHAKRRGLPLASPTFEDVRSMAATIFIRNIERKIENRDGRRA